MRTNLIIVSVTFVLVLGGILAIGAGTVKALKRPRVIKQAPQKDPRNSVYSVGKALK